MLQTGTDLIPFDCFESASRAVLSLLHERLGFDLWMMTRTDGQDWIVLQVEDHGYKVKEGSVFRWADSFCSQMVQGLGPRIAHCAQDIPSYAAAPIGQQVSIGAYIGVPIKNADGTLFGTLCAIDPRPQNESIQRDLPWIELIARMLATILINEMKAIDEARRLEQSHQATMKDTLTGLLNRPGWDGKVAIEETRARRYGSPMCIVKFAISGLKKTEDPSDSIAEDSLIKKAAVCILNKVGENDCVAHLGGGEFAVLGVEWDLKKAKETISEIVKAMEKQRMDARVGHAMRNPNLGLSAAVEEADRFLAASKVAGLTSNVT